VVATAAEDRLNIQRAVRTRRLRQPAIAEQSRFMSTGPRLVLGHRDDLLCPPADLVARSPWRLALQGLGRFLLLPERQRGLGVDHLPPSADPPQPVRGDRIIHRAVAAIFEPVIGSLAVLALPEPLAQRTEPRRV